MHAFLSDEAENRLLNLLLAHCRSAARGLDRVALEQAWEHSGTGEGFGDVLARLVAQGLLEHWGTRVRPTHAGFLLLTDESIADDGVPADVGVGHAPASEYLLRERLLRLLARNGLMRGGSLTAARVSEQWAVSGFRGEDLRVAVDIALRDGQIALRRLLATRVLLREDGKVWLRGRDAPEAIARHAPPPQAPVAPPHELDQRTLTAMVVWQFRGDRRREAVSVPELMYLAERQFGLPTPVAFHAVELVHRTALADADGEGRLRLNDAGQELLERIDRGRLPAAVASAMTRWADRALEQGT